MTATQARASLPLIDVTDARPPAWVSELPGLAEAKPLPALPPLEVRLARGEAFSRLEVAFGGIGGMDILTFQQTVADAYRAVFDALVTLPTPFPVRFWAFVPEIHGEMGQGLDRYMGFNAGRFSAYSAWCGGREAFSRSVATASAIGFGRERLVLHCLASCERGTPFENPLQVPAYRYSHRHGPLPPCFARATSVEVGGVRRLLVAGTASIRGEESLHLGDLGRQLEETLRNLASVVRSAVLPGTGGASAASTETEADLAGEALAEWLQRFVELRVYRTRAGDTERILDAVLPRFRGVQRVELLQAQLCRPELLVEIEGVADVSRAPTCTRS